MARHLLAVPVAIFTSIPVLSYGTTAVVASSTSVPKPAHFVGAVTCQSSMCHGGASPARYQFTVWYHDDEHSKAYASLVSAFGVHIAHALIPPTDSLSPTSSCVVCHAPMLQQGVTLGSQADATEGVTCEKCHGDATPWLRGHTRPDWTYNDRVEAGMTDLRNAYRRAETCAQCHEAIDPTLIKAGHPKLTFELDGQAASEPRHWKEKAGWFGPKAWLVGQAVALSDVSVQLGKGSDSQLATDQKALVWLLQMVPGAIDNNPAPDEPTAVAAWSNGVAQSISAQDWSTQKSEQALAALADTSATFHDTTFTRPELETRAERLVLGLDRLFKSLHSEPDAAGTAELAALFTAVRDPGHFDPNSFASSLKKFAEAAAPK